MKRSTARHSIKKLYAITAIFPKVTGALYTNISFVLPSTIFNTVGSRFFENDEVILHLA